MTALRDPILNGAELAAEARARIAARSPLRPDTCEGALALLSELEETNDRELKAALADGLRAYLVVADGHGRPPYRSPPERLCR